MAQVYGERWEVLRPLAEGGQAHVFEVRDQREPAGPTRVLKRLKNLKRIERFRRELSAVQQLDHPNVLRVIDFDFEASKPYMVFEHLAGGSLGESIARWSAEPLRAMRLFRDVCAGVAAAHAAGIVHRDLKPDNILLRTPGGPAVVGDFGICYIEDGVRLTATEEAAGPRLYMAPELEDGRADTVNAASDVYSLGKVLYAVLSGGNVFARERHREPGQDLVRTTGRPALEHVNRLLDKMIVADPAVRLPDASAVCAELDKASRLIAHDYRALAPGLQQTCTYCGLGTYSRRDGDGNLTAVRNFGINPVGNPNWRILVCDQCGHVELFRVELATRKDWWGA